MAKYKTPDQVALKNALQGVIRIRRGSTIGGVAKPCTRALPANPPLFPAIIPACIAWLYDDAPYTVAITITPAAGDTTSVAFFQHTFVLTHNGMSDPEWSSSQQFPAGGGLPVRTIGFGYCCDDQSWVAGLIATGFNNPFNLADFTTPSACGVFATPQYASSANTMTVGPTGRLSGTITITGTTDGVNGLHTVGTAAVLTIS